jgi:hypothetical protein
MWSGCCIPKSFQESRYIIKMKSVLLSHGYNSYETWWYCYHSVRPFLPQPGRKLKRGDANRFSLICSREPAYYFSCDKDRSSDSWSESIFPSRVTRKFRNSKICSDLLRRYVDTSNVNIRSPVSIGIATTVAYTLMMGFFSARHLSVYSLSLGFPVGLYMLSVRLMSSI